MEQFCPCCHRHCPADALNCGRGQKYFEKKEYPGNRHPETTEEKIILQLRRCGHFLHHTKESAADAEQLLGALSDEERTTLSSLLEKCLEAL